MNKYKENKNIDIIQTSNEEVVNKSNAFKSLYDNWALTEEEYNKKKKEL